MKKYFLLIIFFFTSFSSLANEIAVVDINFLLKNSNEGKAIDKEFKSQNEKNLNSFKKKEKELKDKENKIASKKNVLSKEDFKKEVQAFSEEVKKYNKGRKEKINKTNNQNNENVVKLLKKINSILIDYSKENNISTTLDKKYVIITKSENDITEKILKILNK